MRQVVLEDKIHQFLARKEEQYPDLHRSVNDLTSDLIAQDRVRNLSRRADSAVTAEDRHSRLHISGFHYAV